MPLPMAGNARLVQVTPTRGAVDAAPGSFYVPMNQSGAHLVAGRCRRDPADPGRYLITLTPLDTPATPLDEAQPHVRVAAWPESRPAGGPGRGVPSRAVLPAP